jgi:hypothetical protein
LDGGSARRKAATYTQENQVQTSIFLVGFEPTIPELERPKALHTAIMPGTVMY